MAQVNYDAAVKSTALATAGGQVVTRSSGAYTVSGVAGIVINDAHSKADVLEALKACMRAFQRDLQSVASDMTDLPTTGATTE